MRSIFASWLVLSFIAVAVFGFAAMDHGRGQNHGCIAAAAQGIDCPYEANPLNFISLTFHINALKNFSTALTLFALVLLAIGLWITPGGFRALPEPDPNLRPRYPYELFSQPLKTELTRWLALHENSPAVL